MRECLQGCMVFAGVTLSAVFEGTQAICMQTSLCGCVSRAFIAWIAHSRSDEWMSVRGYCELWMGASILTSTMTRLGHNRIRCDDNQAGDQMLIATLCTSLDVMLSGSIQSKCYLFLCAKKHLCKCIGFIWMYQFDKWCTLNRKVNNSLKCF